MVGCDASTARFASKRQFSRSRLVATFTTYRVVDDRVVDAHDTRRSGLFTIFSVCIEFPRLSRVP